jgi:hypothetical protein
MSTPNDPTTTATPPAVGRALIDLPTLEALVYTNLSARTNAHVVFTAYDVTSAVRHACPDLEIDHQAVKLLVRAWMRLGPLVRNEYDERAETIMGSRALTYRPCSVPQLAPPAPPAPSTPDVSGAPAPFAPLV